PAQGGRAVDPRDGGGPLAARAVARRARAAFREVAVAGRGHGRGLDRPCAGGARRRGGGLGRSRASSGAGGRGRGDGRRDRGAELLAEAPGEARSSAVSGAMGDETELVLTDGAPSEKVYGQGGGPWTTSPSATVGRSAWRSESSKSSTRAASPPPIN